ncbi:MAG TPA: hypothetical protein VKG23_05010 [Thermoanaerobaculia bacterium]|nr:hypothetical protein [Thermoanaerobaculia bacterium]
MLRLTAGGVQPPENVAHAFVLFLAGPGWCEAENATLLSTDEEVEMDGAAKKRLIGSIEEIQTLASEFASEKEWEELIHFINQPPWTTPAEARLSLTIAESILGQMQELNRVKAGFVTAAHEIVGEGVRAGATA